MRNMILVVASAVALGAATMTTGALAQAGNGSRMGDGARFGVRTLPAENRTSGGRFDRPEFEHRDFDRRFAFRRRFFGPGFGFIATGPYWWDNDWDDGCLSRWERTPFGWRQRLC